MLKTQLMFFFPTWAHLNTPSPSVSPSLNLTFLVKIAYPLSLLVIFFFSNIYYCLMYYYITLSVASNPPIRKGT